MFSFKAILVCALLCVSAVGQSNLPLIGVGSHSASGTWSLVQATGFGTACGASTCAVTVTSTGSNHILVAEMVYNNNPQRTISSVTSGACSGSWVIPAGAESYDATNFNGTNMAYCLTSASGQTSITVTASGGTSDFTAEIREYSYTGASTTFDNSCELVNTASATPPVCAITISGTNDLIVQIVKGNRNVTAVSAGYTDFQSSSSHAGADALNQASVPGSQTWTQASSDVSSVSAIAVKGN